MRTLSTGLTLLFLSTAVYAQAPDPPGVAVLGGRLFAYQAVDGFAVLDGDMILGTLDEVEAASGQDVQAARKVRGAAVYVDPDGNPPTWPGGTIYYTIDANVPNRQRVLDAVAHWNSRTVVRILPRTGQPNYVRFVRGASAGRCSSYVGMIGGEQVINTGDLCDAPALIHELGHAAGLEHEQNRNDRNDYVSVIFENSTRDLYAASAQAPWIVDAVYYDYDSIMHYYALTGSRNGRAVIKTVPLGIPIGESTQLSAGDIDVISRLYGVQPLQTTITTMPAGLPITVDGQPYVSPQSFDWGRGSTHTVEVDQRLDDARFVNDPRRLDFVRWTDKGLRTHTVTADPRRTVFAAVFRAQYKVAVDALGAGTVNIFPPSADGFYPGGTSVRIQAVAASGSRFFRWLGSDPFYFGLGPSESTLNLDVYYDLGFTGAFTSQPVTAIHSDPPGRLLVVDGTLDFAPINVIWEPGTTHTFGPRTQQQFSFDGYTRFRFAGWNDTAAAALRTVRAGDQEATYVARFSAQNFFSLSYTTRGRVFPSPDSPDGFFDPATTVRVDAVPNAGSGLQYWLGDATGRETSKAFSLDQHRSAVALFGPPIPILPVNTGSYLATPYPEFGGAGMAPLEALSLIGDRIGPRDVVAGEVGANGRLGVSAGGIRVLFDTTPAPIVRAGPNRVDVLVPADTAPKPGAAIVVERDGARVAAVRVGITPLQPGLFTADGSGRGPVLAQNENGSPNSGANPAEPGSIVTLRATGAGLLERAIPDGQIMGNEQVHTRAPIQVRVNGEPAEVIYAGSGEGLPLGVIIVRVRLPETLLGGSLPVYLIAGEFASPPGASIAVK